VDGDHYRMLTLDEYRRAMGFPGGYELPPRFDDALKMLGNAVPPPLAAGVVRQLLAAA
jgi:DNA (cytosine-5)-methyltransferase 1